MCMLLLPCPAALPAGNPAAAPPAKCALQQLIGSRGHIKGVTYVTCTMSNVCAPAKNALAEALQCVCRPYIGLVHHVCDLHIGIVLPCWMSLHSGLAGHRCNLALRS